METKVSLKPVLWSEEAAHLLEGATGTDPTYTLADLEREVRQGAATLYCVVLGSTGNMVKLGYVVLWVDNFGAMKELVIQAGEAFANLDPDLAARAALPAIDAMALRLGCGASRCHVSINKFMKALKKAGYNRAEVVFRKVYV